jgi:hypothetical protein
VQGGHDGEVPARRKAENADTIRQDAKLGSALPQNADGALCILQWLQTRVGRITARHTVF